MKNCGLEGMGQHPCPAVRIRTQLQIAVIRAVGSAAETVLRDCAAPDLAIGLPL
jgi:hypothetical protein